MTATPAPTATSTPLTGSAVVVRKGATSQKVATFTFDAGADTGYAASILDTLRANGITAAFGLTGKWADANKALVRRIVNEGHEVINHTYDHRSFTGYSTGTAPLTRTERWDELDRTQVAVKTIAGVGTKPYFRPPYGDYDDSVNRDVYARGYRYNVMWTVDSLGWKGLTAPQIKERCLQLAEPGAIYLFHVGAQSQDGPALQSIIDGLKAKGYSFVPLSAVIP
ncbi:MAG: polysaccharide deacetylase family protein [Chloroflexi bacterium]|nr:polysaccharide deacetylase family protein [Chloroflexota bacterium]